MGAAVYAWLAPLLFCAVGTALYFAAGDLVALVLAGWFSWCLTRANDSDHQVVRYLGWIMLVGISSVAVARLAVVP